MARSPKNSDKPDAEATPTETSDTARELRPGDIGYAPPARIAHPAGMLLTAAHLGYHPGQDSTMTTAGAVPLAMPAPAAPGAAAPTDSIRPSLLSPASAAVVAKAIVGRSKEWFLDSPHSFTGEIAVVAQFYRDLAARAASLATAHHLGRIVEPDQVDKAEVSPPADYFRLRHAAQQIVVMNQIYEAALAAAGGQLGKDEAATIDQVKAEFGPLAQDPSTPEQVKQDPPPPDQSAQAA